MVQSSSKQAEKQYLARTGSSLWERTKPFSPPGTDTLNDSAHILHDFAVALLTLQPASDDLILDLGAGGCWCSDLLARLNRSSVAVDISVDMLRAGRMRPGRAIRAVAGDMEALPFRSGSFNKAICLSAIHHVPDIPRAIHEIARVLTSDGVALFSEPGEGHADAAVSTTATRDFGVLEQDILIAPFMRHCVDAGFEEVHVQPLSHTVPGVRLTVEQWEAWSRLARSHRPRRAFGKIILALKEFLGLGKGGPLFEEALAMTMVRTLKQVLNHHPVIVARKTPAAAHTDVAWRATIDVRTPPAVAPGGVCDVAVRVANIGDRSWRPTTPSGVGYVTVGVQLLDEHAHVLVRDFHRAPLPGTVPPRDSAEIRFQCLVPSQPGTYQLKFDLVAEGVTWFETAGSTPTVVQLTVV